MLKSVTIFGTLGYFEKRSLTGREDPIVKTVVKPYTHFVATADFDTIQALLCSERSTLFTDGKSLLLIISALQIYYEIVYLPMIRTFRDKETERIFKQEWSRKIPEDIQYRCLVKLLLIDSAEAIQDRLIPPSNKLEKLKGKRSNEYSVRINRQWRICFRFSDGEAYDVGIEDYH